MKIVHINTNDTGGGAAIAAIRHCEAMRQMGIDSKVIVVNKQSHVHFVEKLHLFIREWFAIVFKSVHARIRNKMKPVGTYSIMCFGHPFYKNKNVQEADVIFLHWINLNAVSIKGVEEILKLGKPIYWYMHDMFPITGGCHHALDCKGYMSDCKNCPLVENRKMRWISSWQLKRKLRHWSKYKNLHFLTPSTWLAGCVKNSILARGIDVSVVPNVLNTDIFRPIDIDAKEIFGLDPNKKVILFGAAAMSSVYKGTKYAHDCLKQLDPEKYEGLVIGTAPEEFTHDLNIHIVETGYLSDSLSLALAYNACDTFIISSIAENYPNVVLEAMACGKPCAGFKTGGIPDLIHHEESGYLTKEKTTDELLKGITWLFEDADRYNRLSEQARKQILNNNSYNRAPDIYKNIVK